MFIRAFIDKLGESYVRIFSKKAFFNKIFKLMNKTSRGSAIVFLRQRNEFVTQNVAKFTLE